MLRWPYLSLDLGCNNWGPKDIHQSHNWTVMSIIGNQQRNEHRNYLPNTRCSCIKGSLLLPSFLAFLLRRMKLLDVYSCVIYLSWDGSSGSHKNFLKRWHNQAKLCFSLGLSGNIFLVLHLWSRLLNMSLSPPFSPFQSLFAWCFCLQGFKFLKEIPVHVFHESWTLMEECCPLGNQDTKHNLRDA